MDGSAPTEEDGKILHAAGRCRNTASRVDAQGARRCEKVAGVGEPKSCPSMPLRKTIPYFGTVFVRSRRAAGSYEVEKPQA